MHSTDNLHYTSESSTNINHSFQEALLIILQIFAGEEFNHSLLTRLKEETNLSREDSNPVNATCPKRAMASVLHAATSNDTETTEIIADTENIEDASLDNRLSEPETSNYRPGETTNQASVSSISGNSASLQSCSTRSIFSHQVNVINQF